MTKKIKIKRGLEAALPPLDVGEPGFTTDSKKLFVGSDAGNIEIVGGGGNTEIEALVEVTWQELKDKRDAGELIPGAQYRITDYLTTTVQANTQSAGHQFDIIVTADSADKLNENARACLHDDDTRFANSKLEAWKLKYCLDNDTTRFAWANSANGKGVIYRMIDEFNNDVPYDFKNIQFKKGSVWYYTFANDLVGNSYGNKISVYISSNKATLNAITFDTSCYSNTFDTNCYNNTFKYNCSSNTFGDGCYSNTFKYNCSSNTFGDGCSSNTFGINFSSNTFKYGCSSNTFGPDCYSNTFGINCDSNTFGDACYGNTFGGYCHYNTFGGFCHYNTFGNGCQYLQISDISSTSKRYICVENGTRGLSSANRLDLYDSSILNKNYQVTFKKDADGRYVMTWLDDYEELEGKYKDNNLDTVWKALPHEIEALVEVTWQELIDKRDANLLTPGQQYRITDYVTTTVQENTQSAGHQFDIIVTADDVNKLNENARACLHEGDTYFANSQLEAWELKYCLDNNASRFAWAGIVNCKGVIYRMVDEFNNDCPYDFKNIQFKRKLTDGELDLDSGIDTWVYTFTLSDLINDEVVDISLKQNTEYIDNDGQYRRCSDNVIKEAILDYQLDGLIRIQLNDNVFLNMFDNNELYDYYGCTSNTFGTRCSSNTFGHSCASNTFGDRCSSNIFSFGCSFNTFGDGCSSNTFGNGCTSNTFGYDFHTNTVGNNCGHNTFGNNCSYNTFGDLYSFNTFGYGCSYNTFGDGCYYNTFGDLCSFNTFGSTCRNNTFGSDCRYLKISDTSSTKKQYIHVENGVQGASGANQFDLYDSSILDKSYQVTFKKSASGKYLMLWATDNGIVAGKVKDSNIDTTWTELEENNALGDIDSALDAILGVQNMTIADKLLELNDVKQDIKTAIEDKGVDMTDVPFTDYPTKIDSITTGTGMSYHDYAKMLYSMWGYEAQFTEAWTESQNSLEVLFEIPLMLAATNQDFGGGEYLDLYVGTNSALTAFYNLVASGEFPADYAIIINKSVVQYQGDIGPSLSMAIPVYAFGNITDSPASIDNFLIADLTPLGMGLGIALGKLTGVVIPDNSITVRRGFESYEAGLIIPEMIEIVGEQAFYNFNYVDQYSSLRVPYIIGPNVKYIGGYAFASLDYRLPLTIPDSVEWIGESAFDVYNANQNYIVVPRNVTYLGESAFGFGSQEIVIMYPEIPPVLGYAFDYGPFPNFIERIYVPDDAVNAYKSAWAADGAQESYPDKIKAISSLPHHEEDIV